MWEHIADGEPHVFGDRVYVYGSHDTNSAEFQYCGQDYIVWSAPVDDLTDWSYSVYPSIDCGEGGGGAASDACQGIDGRYYTYVVIDYPAEDISFSLTVWVCDTPDGEYEFLSTLKNEDGTDAGSLFDPAVLVDDGTVYLYGGGSECWILDDDMYTVLEKHQLEGDGIKNFAEGSSIRKVTDEAGQTMYCLVYDSAIKNNPSLVPQTVNGAKSGYRGRLEYCYSTSPLGPWTYGGVVVDNGGERVSTGEDSGYFIAPEKMLGGVKSTDYGDYYYGTRRTYYDGNNHGGIEQINGQWYVFYHRQTNADEYSRQLCIEPIEVRIEDGALIIEEAEMTSQGVEANGMDPLVEREAGITCYLTNGAYIYTQGGAEADHPIRNIRNGAIVGYKYFNFESGEYDVTVDVKSLGVGGTIAVVLDDPANAPVATIEIGADASEAFDGLTANIGAVEGKHSVFFIFYAQSEQPICEFNALSFAKAA